MGTEHCGVLTRSFTHSPCGDRRFICRACQVPEPEEHFAVDEYADMVAVSKPMVYITVGELINTHKVRSCTLGGAG